jgi:hypothetical protein
MGRGGRIAASYDMYNGESSESEEDDNDLNDRNYIDESKSMSF